MPSGWCVRGSKQGKESCVDCVCWNLAGKKAEIKSDGPRIDDTCRLNVAAVKNDIRDGLWVRRRIPFIST